MELEMWSGDWGLPSIDYNCLQILCYSRFSGAPLKTVCSNNPWWTPKGSLPVFKHGKIRLYNLSQVIAHLRQQNYNADLNLTTKNVADVAAYSSMLRFQLEPALTLMFWVDQRNYVEMTRPWYAKKLPFPSNYFLPGKMQRAAEKYLKAKFAGDLLNAEDQQIEFRRIETATFSEAQKCLTSLSERLGENDYFFGKSPSSFDAIVFGYLAPLLKVPFPSCSLQNHLKACDNLRCYVEKILQKYFPQSKESVTNEKPSTAFDEDFQNKWRDMFLFGLFASTAMLGYAFFQGLIQFEIVDDDYEEPENFTLLDDYEDFEEEGEEKN